MKRPDIGKSLHDHGVRRADPGDMGVFDDHLRSLPDGQAMAADLNPEEPDMALVPAIRDPSRDAFVVPHGPDRVSRDRSGRV